MKEKPIAGDEDHSQATYTASRTLVHSSSSNTSLSREEIMGIKAKNPAMALRRLVKSRGLVLLGDIEVLHPCMVARLLLIMSLH